MGNHIQAAVTRHFPSWGIILLVWCAALPDAAGQVKLPAARTQALRPILSYISSSWDTLTRSTADCESVADPKLVSTPILYLPAGFAPPAALHDFSRNCNVRIMHLPVVIRGPGQKDVGEIEPPGLLYLENPYVVPGGRFNEMYGWDSYFIIRGLLRDGRIKLARGIVENFFFEIEHYGTVLNANRTYYLTRSQPPFLTSMILAVDEAEKAAGHADPAWLAKAYDFAKKDYLLWTRGEHLAGTTGLSRYYGFGKGPVPEGLHDETGYYRDVIRYFLRRNENSSYVVDHPDAPAGSGFSIEVCEGNEAPSASSCASVKRVDLSADFYKNDRAMRESGFDISFRFGPFGSETNHYAPVGLNSLLYKTERDLETISTWLGHKKEAAEWRARADKRRKIMLDLMWDPQHGLFFDYNFLTKTRSSYEYATTFYPLWAGLATPEQARRVAENARLFEQPGGLAMSRQKTGAQWDFPYGWAPIQLLAVEGLRRYGYSAEADRISYEFLLMVLQNFRRDGNIREKYNVVTDSSATHVAEGYKSNVVGFGWTNGVFLELLNALPQEWADRLARH
jgi:alpha,alpha-trehalase